MSEFLDRLSKLSPKRLALLAVDLQDRLEALQRGQAEPLAVIGLGCRFPGGADDPAAYWRLLRDGRDAVTEVPLDRWDAKALYDPDPEAPGKVASRWGGFLANVDRFDPQFFGIAPREAASMDPQQRLLLETAWEALEHAGQAPDTLAGSATGVFVGICNIDYGQLLMSGDPATIDVYSSTGNAPSVASGRLAYVLGLQGPNVTIDTACSSSLVAVHLAAQGLRNGECRLALAGGSNVLLSPTTTIMLSRARMMAADGRCKTFDSRADGFVRSEGCGVVVLKRLADALADGDRVLAVIRGTAINQDGRSNGLTAPNGPSQVAVIREALARADIRPHQVGYVETHGTGTALGDPIEVQALGQALGPGRADCQRLLIGSVKTNLGHLESAAGIAGLIKVVLALQHGEIPPHLHLKERNPYIAWDELPIDIPTARTPWRPIDGRRIAGVSSFGFSGTNAHLVLEEAPIPATLTAEVERPLHLLTLSARGEAALAELAARYERDLAGTPARLADIAFTANTGRAHFAHRLAIVAADAAGARDRLAVYLAGAGPAEIASGQALEARGAKVAFLFTGQGSHYAGMGRRLYETQPAFRAAIDRCDALLRPHLDRSLPSILWPETEAPAPADSAPMDDMAYAQPALFAFEYALAELWRSWGVEPAAVMGHSAGEYVAACLAGVFSLEDGLKLIATRGRLMAALPPTGAMAAVKTTEARVAAVIAPQAGQVAIAAVNGPESIVISGVAGAVERVVETLQAEGVETRRLNISIAAHSPLVEPMLDAFERIAAEVTYHPPRLDLVSCLTGELVADSEVTTPGFWRRHVREAVRFAAGVQALHRLGYGLFVEAGPSPTLLGMGRLCLPEGVGVWLPSLRSGVDDWQQLLTGLAGLYVAGVRIDWAGFDRDYPRRRLALPTYPFQRDRYWLAPARRAAHPLAGPDELPHPLLGRRLCSPALRDVVFETALGAAWPPFLDHHRIFGTVVLPAPAYIELVLAAAAEALGPAAPTLEDLAIQEALILPEEGTRLVQVILTPTEGGGARVQVVSRDERADGWTVHAVGAVAVAHEPAPAGERFDPDTVRARCPEEIAGETYYEQLHDLGLEFGACFRGIRRLWRRDGEAVAEVELSADLVGEAAKYTAHPALLDACFHLLGAAMPAVVDPGVHLLVSLRRCRFRRAPGSRVWSHALVRLDDHLVHDAIDGDLRLYDAEGELVAEIDGLRLRPVGRDALLRAARQRPEWLYEVQWQPRDRLPDDGPRPAPDYMPAGERIVDHLQARVAATAAEHGLALYDALLPALEAVGTEYLTRALTRLGWVAAPGERVTVEGLAGRLGVVAAHRRLFDRLLTMLAEDGVLRRAGEGWEVCRPLPTGAKPAAALTGLRAAYPAAEAEVTLLGRCGERLDDVLRGACDPLDLLFPGGSLTALERLYTDSPFARFNNALVQAAVSAALADLPAGRDLRVLEIGAGTGATTAAILTALPADRTDYLFTDVSPLFTAQATERFRAYPFVRYGLLDIETDPVAQGLAPHQFDLILAANVLHATADLRQTLAHVRHLLAPGGLLLLLEGAERRRWVDLTFGLTDGWWKFSDTALRPDYPLLTPPAWTALLTDLGFGDVATLPAAGATPRPGQQAIILARGPAAAAATGDEWLILADATGVGQALADWLRACGEHCVTVRPGPGWRAVADGAEQIDPARAEDYAALLRSAWTASARTRRIVHLWSLDLPSGERSTAEELADQTLGCESVLRLLQAVAPDAPPPQLWLVTRGAQPAAQAPAELAVAAAPMWGLGRVIALEHPEWWGGLIDLAPDGGPAEVSWLLTEIRSGDGEDQVALRGGQRLAARLARRGRLEPRPIRLRPDTTYLVTGGLGGLGLGIARWLVDSGARHLTLLGRRGLPERAIWPTLAPETAAGDAVAAIRELEARGVSVAVRAADVTDRARLGEVFAEFGASLPPLRGVMHAAAALSAHPLAEMSPAALAEMLAPKVVGTWLLHELTRTAELDFFVLFSSTTALLGASLLGHYAAANAFLDAVAHHRRAGGLPALSVNWGTWDVMRAASAESQQRAAQIGLRRMASDQALALLGDALGQPAGAQLVIADVDWSALKPVFEARRPRPLLSLVGAVDRTPVRPARGARPDLLHRLASARPEDRHELLAEHIRREVAAVLGLDPALLSDPQQGLFDLGMDSLMSVDLKGRLETATGRSLPSTLTFNYPSVGALTDFLAPQVQDLEATPAAGVPPASPPSRVADAPVGEDADRTEDELVALLSAKLAQLR